MCLVLSACGGPSAEDPPANSPLASHTMSGSSANVKQHIPGEKRSYNFTVSTTKYLIGHSRVASLPDFEKPALEVRLQDISLAFDQDGTTAILYRLYRAAFGRTPDVQGLGFWKSVLESGAVSIEQVAANFLGSKESQTIYGSFSSNADFISRLYKNVLGRTGDSDGTAFWTSALERGVSRSVVLLAMADSPENRALTRDSILRGVPFAEPGVAYIPVSNAQGPNNVPVGIEFSVDGAISTDANDDVLSYAWSITNRPALSSAVLTQPSIPKPKLYFDVPGTYQITLWTSDRTGTSFSPAQLQIVAHAIQTDTGANVCYRLDDSTSRTLYSQGHTYLDRDRDGTPCTSADINLEKNPPTTTISDSGVYKCATLTQAQAMLLYLQGHNYLDRDRDGRPCESNDINVERATYTPPSTSPPSGRQCWVNGYRRSNGTWVNGYWRRC